MSNAQVYVSINSPADQQHFTIGEPITVTGEVTVQAYQHTKDGWEWVYLSNPGVILKLQVATIEQSEPNRTFDRHGGGQWSSGAIVVPATMWGRQQISITAGFGLSTNTSTKYVSFDDPTQPSFHIAAAPTPAFIPSPLPPASSLGANVIITGQASAGPSGIQSVEWSLDGGPWHQAIKTADNWTQWTTADGTAANGIRLTTLKDYTLSLRCRNGSGIYSDTSSYSIHGQPAIALTVNPNAIGDQPFINVPAHGSLGTVTLSFTVSGQYSIGSLGWRLADTNDGPISFAPIGRGVNGSWTVTISGINAVDKLGNLLHDQPFTIRVVDTATPPNYMDFPVSLLFKQEL